MRVTVEAQSIIKSRSGIGWYTYNIISEMLKLHEKDINFVGTAFDLYGRNQAKKLLDEVGFTNAEIFKMLPYKAYKLMWNIIPISYNRLFTDSDIFHFFNFIVPPISKGKVITTIHDVAFKLYPETLKTSNYYFLKSEINKSMQRADIIVAVSESTKRDIVNYLGVDEKKIRIVKNATNCDFFAKGRRINAETRNRVEKKYGLPQKYILYLGTIEPRKNITGIFEAYALLSKDVRKEIKLVIAGGKGWKYEDILELPDKLNIKQDVYYTGYVEEEDKPYIYGMAEVFVFPSLYEGFGIPVLEAFAAGVPVITSNCSSLPEVGGAAALYVAPKDSDSIAKQIITLLSNPDVRNKKIALGYDQVKEFSWRESAKKTIEIYRELYRY